MMIRYVEFESLGRFGCYFQSLLKKPIPDDLRLFLCGIRSHDDSNGGALRSPLPVVAISCMAIKSKFQSLRSVTPPINRNRNSLLPFNSKKEKKMRRLRFAVFVHAGTPFPIKQSTSPYVSVTLSEIAERRWSVKLIASLKVGQGKGK